jgi:hypothetical protein
MSITTFVPLRSLIVAIAAGCLAAIPLWSLRAQVPAASPVATPDAGRQAFPPLPDSSPASTPAASPGATPQTGLQALPQTPDSSPTPAPAVDVSPPPTPVKRGPTAEPGDPTLNTNNSFWLDNYPLNDLFQYLARQADYQYFQNPFVDAIKVTGELFKGNDPVENMRELALQYNLVLFQKGRTLYALTQDQIATLPQQEYRYELKYLHPKPEDIQRMLGHFLTPDHGSATLEPQINTIVVSDNETVIPKIARYLKSIDVPRRQISIQVRVISITTSGDKYTGVDWSQGLAATGVTLSASAQTNLDSTFGFRPFRNFTHSTASSAPALGNAGTNVIIGPVTLTAVLHALYQNTKAHEENAPMVITEDNQPSEVRVVTRTPIIVSTTTFTTSGTSISNDVRYLLDKSDPANREIGTTLLVTPSILPDNTIRLAIDGTVAAEIGTISAPNGTGTTPTLYPIVNEAHIVNLSRVPSGYSLILGGFTTVDNSTTTNKIPVLGSLPLLGQAFRFKSVTRTRTNLAFIITPIAFPAGNPEQSVEISEHDRASLIGPEHDLADPDLLGRTHENATDFHNAISTGQFQESDKNPVNRNKPSKVKKLSPPPEPFPQTQSANPVGP